MINDWAAYMRRVTAGATQVQIAEQTGIEQTSIFAMAAREEPAPR